MSASVTEETVETTTDEVDDIVNPWEISATKLTGVDYDKLIRMKHCSWREKKKAHDVLID